MSNSLDLLLSEAEIQRLDYAFSPPTHAGFMPLSDAEELIWFTHQQQGDAALQQVMAWQFRKVKDAGRIISACHALLTTLPGINVRYAFDDQEGLIKQGAETGLQAVTLLTATTHAEAERLLLAAQAQPIALDRDAPLRVVLINGVGDNLILGLIRHDILAVTHSWSYLLAGLSALHNDAPLPVAPTTNAQHEVLAATRHLPWPQRDFMLSGAAPSAGARAIATFTAEQLAGIKNSHTLLADIALRFGHFIVVQSGGQPIQLSVPLQGDDAFPGFGSASIARLTVTAESGLNTATILNQAVAEPANSELAQVEVRWQPDFNANLHFSDIEVEALLLPPLHSRHELNLTINRDVHNRLTLDLSADARLSAHAVPFLLEQFAATLLGDNIAVLLPTQPAAAERKPAPQGENRAITALILKEFRDALAAAEMTADEDFFDRGGHSLVATRVIGRLLSQHQIEININDLFNHPSARALSAFARHQVAEKPADEAVLVRSDDNEQAPLSLAQASLWKVYEAFDHNDIFNLPFAVRFLDEVDEQALRQAFIDVMVRHSVLRSLFISSAGEVRQRVVPQAGLSDYRWFFFSDGRAAGDIDAMLAEVGDHQFDLACELPFRATMLRDAANNQQVMSLLFHHVVLDEWSLNLMMDELGQAYAWRVEGRVPEWPGQPPQFYQFARQQQASGIQQTHLEYWLENLRGAPLNQQIFNQQSVNDLSVAAHADVDAGWLEFAVEPQVAAGLFTLARRNNASLFNAVYAGIAAALHLTGGPADMLIGTSTSGRNDASYFDTLGYFTTVVVHRVRFDAQLTVSALLMQVRNTINGSLPYTDIPIDLVEEGLFGADADRKNHMFETFIQIHSRVKLNGEIALHDGRQLAYRQVEPEKTGSLLGLQFEVMEECIEGVEQLRVMMTWRTDHYRADQAQQIADHIQQVFTHFAADSAGKKMLNDLTA